MVRGNLIIVALAGLALWGCNSGSDSESEQLSPEIISGEKGTPRLTFQKTHHNFGNVNEGDILEYSFKFTNTGDGDLLIANATASCGCTVPQWPKYPIKPGKSDVIAVRFDTHGKSDATTKTVTITANTEPSETALTISAFVIKKEE
jgi:hypothetical protein